MKVTGQYLLNHGVDLLPGYEIDPDKEYWYDTVTNEIHEPLSLWRRWWSYLPWMRWRDRRQWRAVERERLAILRWEMDNLPSEINNLTGSEPFTDMTLGQCFEIVLGASLFSDDSLSLEMAADTICSLLGEYPTAEKAFRQWFVTRYTFYA